MGTEFSTSIRFGAGFYSLETEYGALVQGRLGEKNEVQEKALIKNARRRQPKQFFGHPEVACSRANN